MNTNILLFLSILLILLTSIGCNKTQSICNPPYFEYMKEQCCLDNNSNKICDNDESTAIINTNSSANIDAQKETTNKIIASNEDFIKELMDGVIKIDTKYGNGTGFLISSDGYAITNHHVIMGYEDRLNNLSVTSYDGGHSSSYNAEVIGYDYSNDIAVIKIDSSRQWKYFTLADSNLIKVGDAVYAMGSPLGYDFSISKGIISGKNRPGLNDPTMTEYLQTDAPVNLGNSGGPLVNEKGDVIGLNTYSVRKEVGEGIGFALTSNRIRDIYNHVQTLNTWGNVMADQIKQITINQTIQVSAPNFQISWDKIAGKGIFSYFECTIRNEGETEQDLCFNLSVIQNGIRTVDKELPDKVMITPEYKLSSKPINVNLVLDKEAVYYFMITSFECNTKELYQQSILKKAYYKKSEQTFIVPEHGSVFAFGKLIRVEEIRAINDKGGFSINIIIDGESKYLQTSTSGVLRIADLTLVVEEIGIDYIVLIVSN